MFSSKRNTFKLSSSAIVAIAALTSCSHIANDGVNRSRPTVADATTIFGLASATHRNVGLLTSHTTSLALDRIDQRQLPLDETYRRTGSGRGVTIYVFDGGISKSHPELAGRVRVGYSAFPSDPAICNAHGTAVAGAIAGTTLGVAPEAEIVDVKMVQCGTLRGTIKGIVDGAKWAIEDHALRGGPAVVNWSFIADTSTDIPALDSAVIAIRKAGMAVVVSAGNVDLNACQISPANAKGTIVVGASSVSVDSSRGTKQPVDVRATDTAWGSCIDVFAPGDSVLLPSLDSELRPISQLWNGTSMAAGYVSGAVALFLQVAPTASPDDVRDFLRRTATPNVVMNAKAVGRLLFVGMPGSKDIPAAKQVASSKPR